MAKTIGRGPSPRPFDDECCWPGCELEPHPDVPICRRHVADVWLVGERTLTEFLAPPPPDAPPYVHGNPVVYYVWVGPDLIKIGTTISLKARLGQLRLEQHALIVTEPGGQPLERMRHLQFKHLRMGRWENFRAEPDLMSHVEMLRAHFSC